MVDGGKGVQRGHRQFLAGRENNKIDRELSEAAVRTDGQVQGDLAILQAEEGGVGHHLQQPGAGVSRETWVWTTQVPQIILAEAVRTS